jgi:exodeoxyribonuclease VII small subunit
MPKSKANYASLNLELNTILDKLQQSNIQVDEAVTLYEQGLKVVAQLETHLQEAEHTLKKLTLQVGDKA